jgi:hypothetical protein
MYGGLDKGGGGVVGPGADPFLSGAYVQNVEEIVGSAAGDETICCQEEDGTKAFLSAVINPNNGEVEVSNCCCCCCCCCCCSEKNVMLKD